MPREEVERSGKSGDPSGPGREDETEDGGSGDGDAGWRGWYPSRGATFAVWLVVGVALGAAMDNVGAGLAVGAGLGAAFASRRSRGE